MKPQFLFAAGLLAAASCTNNSPSGESREQTARNDSLPNIVVVYVDDLGYGDVGCYGAKGVETPYIDSLAAGGLKFTDAHCPAATSTPSRFSLLTGKHAFRNRAGILPGDAPLLIRPGTPTLPGMLQEAGYKTAVVGKWHLGLGDGNVDWNDSIAPGPLEIGFDYSFLIPATGDRVPCVYVENHHVVDLDSADPITVSYGEPVGNRPTGLSNPEMLRMPADTQHSATIVNGVSRIGYMAGGESALWKDEDFPDLLTQKAKKFMTENKDQPFFLFFSFHDIHVPRIVHPRFKGKSSMGARGDAIAQMDWCTGEIVKTIRELGLEENTLIIFSSDNGPVLNDGYEDQAVEMLGDHKPAGVLRGGKYSIFEAGTRVPTIAYWKGRILPGQSDALISQIDLFASLAALVGQKPENGAAPDSENLLSTWLGDSEQGRDVLIEEAFTLALRKGTWKYIVPKKEISWIHRKAIESGHNSEPQLYDLSADIGEQNNLAEKYPEKVEEMQKILNKLVGNDK